jgi:hypothetical protein
MLTRNYIPHISFFFLLCIFSRDVMAQAKSAKEKPAQSKSANPVKVNISVNRNRILLGERLELTLALETAQGTHPDQWPYLPDSINHLEILDRASPDSQASGSRMLYSQVFTLTSFDSGHWVIPPVSVMVNHKPYKSDSVFVDVGTVVLKGNEYHDIKEIIEVPAPGFDWKKWLPYIIGNLLILILLVFWWKNRNKSTPEEKPVSRSTAFEEAMAGLKKLKFEQLPEKGEMKPYYTRLYDIYRIYLGRYAGKKLMQSTTDDLLMTMKDILPAAGFSKVAEVLRITDAVKFAKYLSSLNESGESWNTVQQSIEEINRLKA